MRLRANVTLNPDISPAISLPVEPYTQTNGITFEASGLMPTVRESIKMAYDDG